MKSCYSTHFDKFSIQNNFITTFKILPALILSCLCVHNILATKPIFPRVKSHIRPNARMHQHTIMVKFYTSIFLCVPHKNQTLQAFTIYIHIIINTRSHSKYQHQYNGILLMKRFEIKRQFKNSTIH